MRVAAYIPLHYGSEYLDVAIRSIDPCVEKIFIVYSKSPSHSHGTNLQCPDTEYSLKKIAYNASEKVEWHSYDRFDFEGQHRNIGITLAKAKGFDILVTVDSDEVWETEELNKAIKEAYTMDNSHIEIDGFIHFWRSFNHVCRDWFHPVRLLNLNSVNPARGTIRSTIYHFGYAQNEETMRYKLDIHGHKNELRQGWLEDKWLNWKVEEGDVHPVSIGLWNPESFDKTELPEILKNHPNYNKQNERKN